MKFSTKTGLLFLAALLFSKVLSAQVSGKVFHDVNANGTQQSSNPTEPSLAGVTVTAFKPDGTSVTANTDVNGNYSFSAGQIPSGTAVRVEFTALPSHANQYEVGGTLVQFLTAPASNVNLGVTYPGDYCQSNPLMVTPCYLETADPNLDIMVRWSYNNTGIAPLDKTAITHSQQTGSLWGLAYSRSKKLIYAAATLKTHVPLATEGLDAIYTVDPFSGTPNATLWLELTDDLGIQVSSISANPQYLTNAARGVEVSPQNDAQAFQDVGKVGLGDIELSADEKTLYVVNLYDKKLYAIDVATKTIINSYNIPNPGCNNGQARPWALGEYEGGIYVGVTCDGSASGNPANLTDNSGVGNLSITVYRLDGASFTQVLTAPLDYEREPPFEYVGGCDAINRWKPWTDVPAAYCADGRVAYPTPLLSDIEFDDNGNMILGFIDRTGFQWGNGNYGPSGTELRYYLAGGEILRACKNGSTWNIENGTNCANTRGKAIGVADPDGYSTSGGGSLDKPGEFFEGDYFHGDGNFDNTGLSWYAAHGEITIGGLAYLPGLNEVMSTSYDPVTGAENYSTGGVITLSNATGRRPRNGFQLYASADDGGITQGKGVGLGDLEALCNARPLEISVRVWNDTDEDGIQDPNEAPIGNVCFEIFADFDNNGTPDGAALGTSSSNSNGWLYFTPTNVADGDPDTPGAQLGIQPDKNYIIRICSSDWSGGAGTGDLAGLVPTSKDADNTPNGDARDSDISTGASPQIPISTTLTGTPQFTIGAGFKNPPACQIEIVSVTPSACSPISNHYSIQIEITYTPSATGDINIQTEQGANATFTPNGSGAETVTLPGLTADGVQNIDVTVFFEDDNTCTHTLADAYDAPNSCFMQMQSNWQTPTILSACNQDTLCLTITNLKGQKGQNYGPAMVSINIPDNDLLNFVSGSVYSIPAGAAELSFVNGILTISVPMPSFGNEVKICFAVRPSCNVSSISRLPRFHATIQYPTGYPMVAESVTSSPMNVGAVTVAHSLYDFTTFGNPTPAFGAQYRIISWIDNTGYGSQNEVVYYTVTPNTHPFSVCHVYSVVNNVYSPLKKVVPVSSTPYGSGHVLRKYVIKGDALGADKIFAPNERLRVDEYMYASQVCSTFTSIRWPEISCGEGTPLCQKPDTLYSTITQAAGTPKLEGTLISVQNPDGCPDKHISYKVKNTATGNAAPVGNAYDVNLVISFSSGMMTINDVALNGNPVPSSHLTPNGLPATAFTILLKDKMTTNPDGAGVGIEDLDGDGYYDDMLVGAETQIDFDYTIPCNLACGAMLDYKLTSSATFTDFCRTLKGTTSKFLHRFGFEQVQAIEQLENVDYGALTTGQSATRTAKFAFQYKQHNMDFTNATGELHIKYSKRMEVNPASILLNGVPPTNAPVIFGNNSTGAPPDNDSMYVVQLTSAELTALFDNVSDNLWYDQTYYGCDVRQDNNVGDTWQLFVKVKQDPCSDGSSACAFDVACKKPFVYTYNIGCGSKPCYVQEAKIIRQGPDGWTDVSETTAISPIDSLRSWEGDTVLFQRNFWLSGDDSQEPNGYWTAIGEPWKDLRTNFAMKYTIPKGWNAKNTIWNFLENESTICVYQRTPVSGNGLLKGTIGTKIIEAPIVLGDFATNGVGGSATSQNSFNAVLYTFPNTLIGTPEWHCNNGPNTWHVAGVCPVYNGFYYDQDYNNINQRRYINLEGNKMSEIYHLNIGRALARAGWTGDAGDDNYYFEVKTKWRMNPNFPWDNSNSFSVVGYTEHLGNYLSFPNNYNTVYNSSYNGSCGYIGTSHLTVTKELLVANPNEVYSPDCNLRATHKLFLESQEGNYFRNGEVRVPYKIDSIVVDLPTEYGVAGNIELKYHQNCAVQTATNITASATTGHIIFTKTGGGDFPRADDCAGNQIAYDLCYDLYKIGTAAPTQYRFPIKIYARDEFNTQLILTDSATIAEAKPELVLSSTTPVLQNSDGGACHPAFFEFRIQNNSLFDAGNVYFAAANTAGTTFTWVNDGQNVYADPIDSADVATYAGGIFAKIGTVKAGDIRTIRVFANTNICEDNFIAYADFGCQYPSPLAPNLASPTIDVAQASYKSQKPALATLPIADIVVQNLCDSKTVEVEVRNVQLGNIYNASAIFNLPAGATYVVGSAQYKFSKLAYKTFENVPNADVTQPSTNQLAINLANLEPFNGSCGLPGADSSVLNVFRIKFDLNFTACPPSAQEYIEYSAYGENYCGVGTTTQGVLRINYVGTGATKNNFTFTKSQFPIKLCALQTQPVSDTLTLKNIGGFGTASGITSGQDTLQITLAYDPSKFTLANITLQAPFAAPTFSTDANGNTVLTTFVPAGINVNSTQSLVIGYDLTPLVPGLCSLENEMCYWSVVKFVPNLSCSANGLACSSIPSQVTGNAILFRSFQCCKVALGNLVFMDNDENGTFNSGDMGIDGVTIQLYVAGATPGVDAPVATTTTSGGGFYLFDQLDQGTYFVYIPASNFSSAAPLHNKKSATPEGGDTNDDDNTDENGQNAPVNGGIRSSDIVLTANAEPVGESGAGSYSGKLDDDDVNFTVDFGFVPEKVALGNIVFMDNNNNGFFDAGDMGIDGVELYLYPAGASLPDDPAIASTTTSNGGFYIFDQLDPGQYFIWIAPSNFSTGNPLFDKTSADPEGGDDANDDNADENGLNGNPLTSGILSVVFDLQPNSEPTNEAGAGSYTGSLDDDNVNLTIDFGFKTIPSVCPPKVCLPVTIIRK